MTLPRSILDRMEEFGLCVEDYLINDVANPTEAEIDDFAKIILVPLEQNRQAFLQYASSLKEYSKACRERDCPAGQLSIVDTLKRECVAHEIRKWEPARPPEKRYLHLMEVVIAPAYAISAATECAWFNDDNVVALTTEECLCWLETTFPDAPYYQNWWWVREWVLQTFPRTEKSVGLVWDSMRPPCIPDDRLVIVMGSHRAIQDHPSMYAVWWELDGESVRMVQRKTPNGFY